MDGNWSQGRVISGAAQDSNGYFGRVIQRNGFSILDRQFFAESRRQEDPEEHKRVSLVLGTVHLTEHNV